MTLRCLLMGAAATLALAGSALAQDFDLASPDGQVRLTLSPAGDGPPTYAVRLGGREILSPSSLTLDLETGGPLGRGMTVEGAARRQGEDRYALIGKASQVRKPYNELTVDLSETAAPDRPARAMRLVFRAYDDGVAFRYVVPAAPGAGTIGLRAEGTQFTFPADYRCWGLNLGRFNSSHEGEFDPVQASRIRDHNAYDAPLVCETGEGGPAFALAEADLRDYPALYLTGRGDGGPGVQARLAPRLDDPQVSARTRVGSDLTTPWRVVMLADRPGELIESTLVTDLSPGAAFDASWVKPGKAAWDWWNGGQVSSVPNAGMNTETFKAYIDFAAANGLEYVMIDEGWNLGAGGGGIVRRGVDVTRTIPEIDMPALVAYGRERGVGLLLWVNWKALDAQFDAALDQYQDWGVAGIKVDFMDRDDQQMVDWYHRLLSQAADHRLLVDLHGAFHPTGLARTYPNYLTQEGVLGAEYNKWSSRVTASHNVTLPYTRMILGPIDYTPGGFRNVRPEEFEHRFILPTVQTTRAHGLAMYVVYDSPLAIVADTPDAYAGQSEMPFLRAVPTTWDETRFIAGEIGQSIVMARRKGADWYLGAMTNEEARTVTVPLDFLGDRTFTATIYADGDAPDRTRIETRTVRTGDSLTLDLAGSGGAAVRLTPR